MGMKALFSHFMSQLFS